MPFKIGNQFGKQNQGRSRTPSQIQRLIEANSDSRSHLWKGGHIIWKKKQARIRDDYTCRVCGLRDPEIMEVDHHVARFKGGTDDISNLVTLCPNCHRRKTNREKEGALQDRTCPVCKVTFLVRLKRKAQIHCSRNCANKAPLRCEAASKALKGRVFTPEWKRKISIAKTKLH